MNTFRELIESTITTASVDKFLHSEDMTNFDVVLDDKKIKFSGYVPKTGTGFDDMHDIIKSKYGRKFSFVGWNKEIANFEIKI